MGMKMAARPAGVAVLAWLLCIAATVWAADPKVIPHGRLEVINGCTVVSLDGTPEEMGAAHGQLLGETIRRVVRDVITEDICSDADARANVMAGSKRMETHQPAEYLAELRALAAAAAVSYDELLLLQYFGDVRRGITGAGHSSLCTSFAVLPPNTRGNVCLVGRNFDYFYGDVNEYASVIIYYRPAGKIPFATITWAGVINGWTLLSANGIAVSNNTVFGDGRNSLEGMSTCFLLRHVAERARTVQEGIDLISNAPRACATNMLIASGNPPDAAIIEFEHDALTVRRPKAGFVGAGNGFLKLHREDAEATPGFRLETAESLARAKPGALTLDDNIAGAEGVPITGINLHSAMIDATNLRLRIAMGAPPACKLPYQSFRLTDKGLAQDMPETLKLGSR